MDIIPTPKSIMGLVSSKMRTEGVPLGSNDRVLALGATVRCLHLLTAFHKVVVQDIAERVRLHKPVVFYDACSVS